MILYPPRYLQKGSSVMQMLTMERVKEFDCDREVATFLRHVRGANLRHEDNAEELVELSERLDIDLQQLSSYVWLQIYISDLIESCEEVPDANMVAQQFGIDFDQFQDYICHRAELCDLLPQEIVGPTDEELAVNDLRVQQREAFLKGMNLFEYREYMADLLLDADLQG